MGHKAVVSVNDNATSLFMSARNLPLPAKIKTSNDLRDGKYHSVPIGIKTLIYFLGWK